MYPDLKALRLLGIASLLALQAACHHTYMIDRESASSLAVLNEAAESRTGSLVLRSGDRFEAVSLQAAYDSTRWNDLQGQVYAAATPDVAAVTYRDRRQGARHGFFIFGAIGAAAGGYLAGSVTGGFCESSSCSVAGAVVAGALVGGWLAGMLLGLPVGAMAADTETYQFLGPDETGRLEEGRQRGIRP